VELGPESGDGLGVGPLAHHGLHRITGRDVQQKKGDGQDAEQGRDQQAQPAQEETRHRIRSA
jgi:hypothetical protein